MTMRNALGWVLFGVALHSAAPVTAIQPFPQFPQRVWLTGTLTPLERPGDVGFHALILVVGDREWLMRLSFLRTESGRSQPDWTILTDLFPPRVRVSASDAVMRFLTAPERAGDVVRIEANLYIGSQTLDVFHLKVLELGAASDDSDD